MPNWGFYDLLKEYKKNQAPDILEELIEKNVSLVEHQVKKIYSNYLTSHLNITREDLISFGLMGLIDAFNKYDFNKNIPFKGYARMRIKGAIIDGIRKFDFVPRNFRSRAIKYSEANYKLEQELGRSPKEEELASYLNITVEELRDFWQKTLYLTPLYLDRIISTEEEESETFKDNIKDDNQIAPQEVLDKKIDKELLREAIDNLPEREKLILSLYYYEDLTIKEISKVMDLSESRISQLHTKAIFRLRGKLSKHKDFFS